MDLDVILSHREFVRAVARSLLRDENRIDDVEQETYLAALGKRDLRPEGLRGWLAAVTRNFARKELRSDRRRRAREEKAARPEITLVDRVSKERDLVKAVLELDEPYRGAVLLRYYEGLTPKEIAARQGLSAGTVRSRLSRAVGMLRERLDGPGGERRREWAGLLFAISRAAPNSGGATPAIGALLVSTKAKIAVAAVLLALLLGVTIPILLDRAGPGAPNPPAPPVVASGTGRIDAADTAPEEPADPIGIVEIAGAVYDVRTMHPVVGARVGLATTGDDGSFQLSHADRWPAELTARADGFLPGTALVMGAEQVVEFFLLPAGERIPELPERGALGGGVWLGPSGSVPPGMRNPTDPQPPAVPSYQNWRGPAPRVAPDRPAVYRPMSFADWEFWWAYRRREIIAERLGRPPDRAALAAGIATTLREKLDDEEFPVALRPGSVLALAGAGDPRDAERLLTIAREETDRVLLERAIYGLGLLGHADREVIDLLHGVLADPEWPARARCFAAVSLGLLGREDESARRILEDSLGWYERIQDPTVAKVVGLALAGAAEGAVPLFDLLDDPGRLEGELPAKLPDGPLAPQYRVEEGEEDASEAPRRPAAPPVPRVPIVPPAPPGHRRAPGGSPSVMRAHVLFALGELQGPEAIPSLTDHSVKGHAAPRAAVVALGRVAVDGAPVYGWMRKSGITMVQSYGPIALGRIGARHPESREICRKVLHDPPGGLSAFRRSYVALGLAVLGDPEEAEGLRAQLTAEETRPALKGALAISLGLLGDQEAVPALLAILTEPTHQPDLRGAAAEALGLIGAPEAREPILAILTDPRERKLWRNAATAAGLLGGKGAKEALLFLSRSPFADSFALGSAREALASMADAVTVEALVKIAFEEGASPTHRLTALSTLARIADRRTVTIPAWLSARTDYRSCTPFLDELLHQP